jgi:hypothetical protein
MNGHFDQRAIAGFPFIPKCIQRPDPNREQTVGFVTRRSAASTRRTHKSPKDPAVFCTRPDRQSADLSCGLMRRPRVLIAITAGALSMRFARKTRMQKGLRYRNHPFTFCFGKNSGCGVAPPSPKTMDLTRYAIRFGESCACGLLALDLMQFRSPYGLSKKCCASNEETTPH